MAEETGTKSTFEEYKKNVAQTVRYDVLTGKSSVVGDSKDGKGSGDTAGKDNNLENGAKKAAGGSLKETFQAKAQQVKPNTEVLNTLAPNLADKDDKDKGIFVPSEKDKKDKPELGDAMVDDSGIVIGGRTGQKHNVTGHDHTADEYADMNGIGTATQAGFGKIVHGIRGVNINERAEEEKKEQANQVNAQNAQNRAMTQAALVESMRTMTYSQWSNMTVGQRQNHLDAVDAQLAQTNSKIEADRAEYLDLTKQSFQLRFGEAEGAKMADQAHRISQESHTEAMQRMGVTEADFKNMTPKQSNELHTLQDKIATEKAKALYPNDAEKQKEVAGAAREEHGYDKRVVDGAIKAEGMRNGTQENQTNQNDQGMGEGQAGEKQIQVTTDDSNFSANRRRQEIADYKAGNNMSATASTSNSAPSDAGYTATQASQTQTITPTYNGAANGVSQQAAPATTVALQGASYTKTFNDSANNGAIVPAQNLTVAQQQQVMQQQQQMALIAEFERFRQMMAEMQGIDPNKVQVIASNAVPQQQPVTYASAASGGPSPT